MNVTSHCTDTKWPGIKEVPLSQFSYMIGQYNLYEDAWMTVLQKKIMLQSFYSSCVLLYLFFSLADKSL
jgi:hypothetical protein